MPKEKLTHFDLFSGYGGFSLALEKVYGLRYLKCKHICEKSQQEERSQGRERTSDKQSEMFCSPDGTATLCHTIGFSEIDKYASAVLKCHWPNTKNYGDIKSIDARSLPDFDLLTGGFPCQSFSIAGKRGGFEDTRGTLAFDMLNIAKEKTPKYILAENVKGLMSHDKGRTIKTILASFQELGYAVSIEILNAKNYGVPQNRERVFILGMHIQTICKEIINTGFQAKTDTSVKIIKGFLFQNLLNNLTEVQRLQETASKDLVCGLMVLSAITNGLKGKLKFSNETYKNHWQSFVGLSLKEMRERFTTKLDSSVEKPSIKDGILDTEENTSLSAEIELWQNIEKLWQTLWVEVYPAQSKSTTLTAITQTTEKKTFTYAEMLLTIVSFIIQLRNSSSHLWNEVLLDLIVLKGNTFYEPITSKTEERIIGRSCFIRRSNLSESQRPINCFVVGFRDGSPREVLFERGTDNENKIKVVGELDSETWLKRNESIRRVHSPEGIAPTTPTGQGGGVMTKVAIRVSGDVDKRKVYTSETNACLAANPTSDNTARCVDGTRIRRLTPTECERLMGLPDGWTKFGADFVTGEDGKLYLKQKEISDSQRYKLCGNGVVVNVVEEILKQLII